MYNEKRLLETYFDLIRINSVTGNERDIALYIHEAIEEIGLKTNWSYYNGEESPSLYTVLQGKEEGPTILLIGHIDTVAVYDGWKTDPFEPVIDGNKVYGLGACDMKGGIGAILEVLRVMVNRKDELKGTIIAAFVADEEYLSRGTHGLLADGLKADMAIMAECRFDEMAVGFRGRYSIGIDVSGETAHASKYPHAGESAIINAARLAQGIEELPTKIHSHLGAGTWCIRHIAGGVKNTLNVPDKCNLFVDRYVVPGESFEICKEQIEDLAKELGLEDKISVELVPRGETPYMESFSIPEDHILVTTISEKFKDIVGKELAIGYDPSVCDSNYLYQLGNIPTVTFGPSGKHLHAPNEFGYMDQVKYSAQIYLKTLEELLF